LTGAGVNVTVVPEHVGFADGAIVTLTGAIGLTVIATVLDVAGLPVTHAPFDVSTQVTLSLFNG
jgi:hypothetical protein